MNFSIRSPKSTTPTRSLLRMAEKPKSAATRAAISRLNMRCVPKSMLPLMSTSSMSVSSRSSANTLT